MSNLSDVPEEVLRHQLSHQTPQLAKNEQRTRWVVILTLLTMIVELGIGWYSHSMALLADGWHMGAHAGALGLTLFGYWFARKYSEDPRFSFGTGKVFALTGFASAITLGIAGLLVAIEAIRRLIQPEEIDFNIAMITAFVGLVVNLLSAFLLGEDEAAAGCHSHSHSHGHSHDHNLRGAYLHVLADALTSVLAIVALALGKWLGWVMLDPIIGVLGGVIIIKWALALCRDTTWVLLDAQESTAMMDSVKDCLEAEKETWVVDLHIWDLGLGRLACILSVVSKEPKTPEFYKAKIATVVSFSHVNVEVFPFETTPAYRILSSGEEQEHDHCHGHDHSHSHRD